MTMKFQDLKAMFDQNPEMDVKEKHTTLDVDEAKGSVSYTSSIKMTMKSQDLQAMFDQNPEMDVNKKQNTLDVEESEGTVEELPISNINRPPHLTESHRARGLCNHNYDVSTDVNHVTNTYGDLNMDVFENLDASKRDSKVVRMGGQRSLQVVTPENAVTPEFGKKRYD